MTDEPLVCPECRSTKIRVRLERGQQIPLYCQNCRAEPTTHDWGKVAAEGQRRRTRG